MEQLGQLVNEKSLSMGTESLSVGEKTITRLNGKLSESESRQSMEREESVYPKQLGHMHLQVYFSAEGRIHCQQTRTEAGSVWTDTEMRN